MLSIDAHLEQSHTPLRLPPALEADFEIAFAPSRITKTKSFLILFLVADLAALILDAVHGSLHVGLIVRLGIAAPAFFVGVACLNVRRSIWQQGLLAAGPVLIGLNSIVLVGLTMAGRFPELYLTAAGMAAFFCNAAFPLRFRHAFVLTIAFILTSTVLVFAWHGGFNPIDLTGTLLFNDVACLLTLGINYRAEQTNRRTFLYELQLRSQADSLMQLNEKLTEVSNTDPLTGLANRRVLKFALDQACLQARRSREGFGLLLIDIDHFKLVNDTAGHAKGDDYLKIVADTIQGEARGDTDTVARIGGEEFAVLMPSADIDCAGEVGYRILRALADRAVPHPAFPPPHCLSVSIGAAIALEEEHWDADQTLQRADKALYAAKEQGRNRVVLDRLARLHRYSVPT